MPIVQIPTMIDPDEAGNGSSRILQDMPNVLFAGAPVYTETIRFIIKSIEIVLDQYPNCRLIITGCRETDPRGAWMHSENIRPGLSENIVFAGYIPRNDLLTLYQNSNALLIPLFDDATSKARFPLKVGEYLLSGRPVITTDIGDITKYLKHKLNAFICKPGDPMAFAELILTALRNPDQANEVGQRGRDVALRSFDYSVQTRKLSKFIMALS
jgi:glycosyltransferase involved in cell wall biosynthesis